MPAPSVFLKDFLGLIGASVGPYVIREVVALGGVAVVYRAEHEAMKSSVAVKVLTPEVVEEAVRPTLEQLFLREAQILGQLRSDDILRAYDHGRVRCGADQVERPYMVVEWLEGKVLSDDIEARRRMRRPYTLAECIELLLPVARALDVAHASGIVHRDVNPRNVFLENMGPGTPRARLIDFGFAKDVAAQAQGLQLQQVAGTLFARSPDYAAPEHYDRAEYGELSESTDVYTFALIFVEMLTLESPLRGDTAEVLAVATANEGDRPTPRRRGAQVSDEVEQLFVEALAINQFDRPQSVLEWFQRLERVAAPPAPSADAFEPVAKSSRPRSFAALGVVLLLVLFVGGAGGLAWWFMRPLACPAGFADCNQQRADGCEVELGSAVSHCGSCNKVCSTSLGEAACIAGACRIGRCPASHLGDCNSDIADGCEVDTRTDAAHCGACGKSCGSQCTKKVSCEAGECSLACKPTCGNCDAKPENGCEATLASDAENCGRCGVMCSGTACGEGLCATKSVGAGGDFSFVAQSAGETFVWDRTASAIRRRDAEGKDVVFAEGVRELTGLVAAKDVVVWAAGERVAEIFARARSGGAAPTRIAGPLLGPTRLASTHGGRHVSWASRPAAIAGKKPKQPPPGQRQIFTARLDAGISAATARGAECPQYPSTFNGDDARQLCCAEGDALVGLTCEGARCKERRYFVRCPKELLLEGERAYFTQDTRVMGMDLESGKPEQLAKRKKKLGELSLDATYVYWVEGPDEAELWRAPKRVSSDSKLGEAQLLARKQRRPRSLSIDGDQLLFATSAASDASSALVLLPLPKLRAASP